MNTIQILGVRIRCTNLTLACETIGDWVSEKAKTYVCVAPVSTIVDCQRNEGYKNIINQAGMVTPDGMPVVWLGKLKGSKVIQRTYGPDLMLALCEWGEDKGLKHFFYGGSEEVISILKNKLHEKFPGIKIAGTYSPPQMALDDIESPEVVAQINESQSDVIWVGLGSPKQDYWMYHHREAFHAPVMIGVGAAFDFLSGKKAQAPKWIQRSGLEWLFRLCCEPRRLWRRYLIGNSLFLYWLLKNALKAKFQKNVA